MDGWIAHLFHNKLEKRRQNEMVQAIISNIVLVKVNADFATVQRSGTLLADGFNWPG